MRLLPPRKLTESDVESFERTQQAPPRSIAQIKRRMSQSDPIRFARMQHDMKWLQKRMKKLGLNPEDAPWLLL